MSDPRKLLVFDASPLYHCALADRLDVLGDLVSDHVCLTAKAVVDEIARLPRGPFAADLIAMAEWLDTAPVESLEVLRHYTTWARRVGAGDHNLGEGLVFALCDAHSATAVVDDRRARKVARDHGLPVIGTLGLIAEACRNGQLSWAGAGAVIDALRDTGARLPCSGMGFQRWCLEQGIHA